MVVAQTKEERGKVRCILFQILSVFSIPILANPSRRGRVVELVDHAPPKQGADDATGRIGIGQLEEAGLGMASPERAPLGVLGRLRTRRMPILLASKEEPP